MSKSRHKVDVYNENRIEESRPPFGDIPCFHQRQEKHKNHDVEFSGLDAIERDGTLARKFVAAFRAQLKDIISDDACRGSGETLAFLRRAMLHVMPYQEYLQTAHWKSLASRVKADWGGRCALCDGGGELHAHHRTYARRGFETDKDVICLCSSCHEKFHDIHTSDECAAGTADK